MTSIDSGPPPPKTQEGSPPPDWRTTFDVANALNTSQEEVELPEREQITAINVYNVTKTIKPEIGWETYVVSVKGKPTRRAYASPLDCERAIKKIISIHLLKTMGYVTSTIQRDANKEGTELFEHARTHIEPRDQEAFRNLFEAWYEKTRARLRTD